MIAMSCNPVWRPAALRGVDRTGSHAEALVALSAGQYLRMPITPQCADAFRARLGGCVWVDLDTWDVRLDRPARGSHA